jgi:hypothetical protein
VHDRGLLAAHPQFLPNFAIHPEYGAAAVAPVKRVRTDPRFPQVLLFAHVIIRNRGALRDVAHAADDARAREHRLADRRLAGRRVTHDGKIPKIPCRRRGHKSNSFLL